MTLPAIYAQPVAGLENFPMSGDDLAVTKHFLTIDPDDVQKYIDNQKEKNNVEAH